MYPQTILSFKRGVTEKRINSGHLAVLDHRPELVAQFSVPCCTDLTAGRSTVFIPGSTDGVTELLDYTKECTAI